MEILEILHLGGTLAAVVVSLYVGKTASQLKESIMKEVSNNYISRNEIKLMDVTALEKWTAAEKLSADRYEYMKDTMRNLKEGQDKIDRRLDELFDQPGNNRRQKSRE